MKSRVNRKARPCRANEACRDEKKEIAREERKKKETETFHLLFFSLLRGKEKIFLSSETLRKLERACITSDRNGSSVGDRRPRVSHLVANELRAILRSSAIN